MEESFQVDDHSLLRDDDNWCTILVYLPLKTCPFGWRSVSSILSTIEPLKYSVVFCFPSVPHANVSWCHVNVIRWNLFERERTGWEKGIWSSKSFRLYAVYAFAFLFVGKKIMLERTFARCGQEERKSSKWKSDFTCSPFEWNFGDFFAFWCSDIAFSFPRNLLMLISQLIS